jgi:hypothetical protein
VLASSRTGVVSVRYCFSLFHGVHALLFLYPVSEGELIARAVGWRVSVGRGRFFERKSVSLVHFPRFPACVLLPQVRF